jgi:transposase
VDPFAPEIAAMLGEDAKVPATVVLQHLRRSGYVGGITILKDHLPKVRPQFLQARCFQRTTYLPGEISQIDWWHTGREIPVGKGAHREAFGLVATLPHSAAHAAVFTFGRTIGDLLPAVLGCFQRLGGVPDKVVCDNDTAIVAERRGGVAILHEEVASFFGQLGTKVVPLRPGDPQAKGQVERTNGYLDRSFLSLRSFSGLGGRSGRSCARCPNRRPGPKAAGDRPASHRQRTPAPTTGSTRCKPALHSSRSVRRCSWAGTERVAAPARYDAHRAAFATRAKCVTGNSLRPIQRHKKRHRGMRGCR